MPGMTTADKAKRLRELHQPPHWPLVLPNAWDAASGRIFEDAGFSAIATTSAGMANALGYADGQRISGHDMVEAVARITRVVSVPVTADVEAGYGDPARTATELWEAGAVGMNLEDAEARSLVPIADQVANIASARAAVPGIVINARTDVFLLQVGEPATRLERTIERMRAFAAAGADSLFVPAVTDEATIAALTAATHLPVNILAVQGAPPIARMRELGVGRITLGSGAMRAAMGLVRRIAAELRDSGTYESFVNGSISYAEINGLFK